MSRILRGCSLAMGRACVVGLATGLLWLGTTTAVSAASLTIRTGVDAGGAVLGSGVADPLWTISVQGGAFVAAEVAAPGHPIICCGMETVSSTARWISDPSISTGSAATGWGVGPTAIARRSFDLSAFDLSTVALTGFWRVADNRRGVFINGNLLPGTNDGGAGWNNDQALNLAAGSGFFVQGQNVIEIRGTSQNSNWDGFWLDVTLEGRDRNGGGTVPEPTTLALMGTALLGAVTRRRRR
ncbi:hypothetical protein TBR22_A39450 [Luteitalea sp. TBR-22]|uniref:PEP-CTERM sorting domain-containing protein n=1 Tax=Luteitalea sp. TBR-22 TaxID=2802971 RepID=UPI001EF6DD44|nr:PEP-CTERM sorting domain-containing protein [Luteitalea sp. TBR-22]BCS34719.2 hypothetical protein TBR22_A39450 [Luteitalea sp. TBR-22]